MSLTNDMNDMICRVELLIGTRMDIAFGILCLLQFSGEKLTDVEADTQAHWSFV